MTDEVDTTTTVGADASSASSEGIKDTGLACLALMARFHGLAVDSAPSRLGVATGVTIGRTDRFLKRLGFKMTGGNYALVVKKGLGNQRLVS